jgi:16S rRNA (guanine527-N7)-methyltransferase
VRKREVFIDFLVEKFGSEKTDDIVNKFDIYFSGLVETNSQINLFSRRTETEDLWTIHFLDSLLPLETNISLDEKVICDFGTGGGLPGIVLAIVYPRSKIYLLDSKQKKLSAIEKIFERIGLDNCRVIHSRIEDIPERYTGFFDILTCRSVKILPQFVNPIKKIVKKDGKILLYKGVMLDDTLVFEGRKLHDVSRKEVGKRFIVEIN